MGKIIYEIALTMALLGCAWNVIALIFHLIGINLPAVDSPFYPG